MPQAEQLFPPVSAHAVKDAVAEEDVAVEVCGSDEQLVETERLLDFRASSSAYAGGGVGAGDGDIRAGDRSDSGDRRSHLVGLGHQRP